MKSLILTLVFLFISVHIAYACYDDWNSTFNAIYEEHENDLDRCSGTFDNSSCLFDANLWYGAATDEAANSFFDCLEQ